MPPFLLAAGIVVVFYVVARLALAHGASPVLACRAAVRPVPGLKTTSAMKGGHVYSGTNPTHVAWVKGYLDRRAAEASGDDARAVLAFRALQGREGSTSAVQTYDNQVLTWGTGWGGKGALGRVMGLLTARSPAVVQALKSCGVEYLGQNKWRVVDEDGRTVEGTEDALQVIRRTPALLALFVHLAEDPATREDVAAAQLDAFRALAGKVEGGGAIATQALYTFAAHLQHWAPEYMKGVVEEAARAVPGPPSPARDQRLAPLMVRGFYRRAPHGSYPWAQWAQLQRYALRDMKEDGLDVSHDPVLTASAPPSPEASA